jgi:hypothetical protein
MRGCDMRGIAAVAIVLGLGAGLLGMFAFTELSGRAGAAGYVTEQSEITLLADRRTYLSGNPGAYYDTYASASIDTTKFPAGATFTLNVSGAKEGATGSTCFRLVEVVPPATVNPIPGSEVCTSISDYYEYFALRSEPLSLSPGDHIYMFQHTISGFPPVLGTVRVVAEWQEYSPAVGGIALLPDIGDSSPSNYIALAALAGLALVALSGGARYARRRWGR